MSRETIATYTKEPTLRVLVDSDCTRGEPVPDSMSELEPSSALIVRSPVQES